MTPKAQTKASHCPCAPPFWVRTLCFYLLTLASVFFGLTQVLFVACTSEASTGSTEFWNVADPYGETTWNEQACEARELSSVVIENHSSSMDFLAFVENLYGESKTLKNATVVRRTKLKRANRRGNMKSKSHDVGVMCKWDVGTRVSESDMAYLTHVLPQGGDL